MQGVGPHWYYDVAVLEREFGWVSGYTTPRPGRYHEGCKAGDLSQTGQARAATAPARPPSPQPGPPHEAGPGLLALLPCQSPAVGRALPRCSVSELLLRSVVEAGGYDAADFTCRLDALLDTLDGSAYSGRYTDVAMRNVWRGRKAEGRRWGDGALGSWGDTAEAAIRGVVLAARYSARLGEAASVSMANARLTHLDPVITGQAMSFCILVAALIQGERLDADLGTRMRELAKSGELPVTHAVLAEERETINHRPADPTQTLPFPDALLQVGWVVQAARDPEIRIPPEKVGLVYGMACSQHFLLPAAYYLAAAFEGQPDHFEQAVLHAINSGGNNMARAALTGALVGAMVGLRGIPERFIDGLTDGAELKALAVQLAAQAFPHTAGGADVE
eukprot:scaffold20.g7733.t1